MFYLHNYEDIHGKVNKTLFKQSARSHTGFAFIRKRTLSDVKVIQSVRFQITENRSDLTGAPMTN